MHVFWAHAAGRQQLNSAPPELRRPASALATPLWRRVSAAPDSCCLMRAFSARSRSTSPARASLPSLFGCIKVPGVSVTLLR